MNDKEMDLLEKAYLAGKLNGAKLVLEDLQQWITTRLKKIVKAMNENETKELD